MELPEHENIQLQELGVEMPMYDVHVDSRSGVVYAEVSVTANEARLDGLHEECGVVGVSRTVSQSNLAHQLANALFTIQHRGQEAAGVGVFDTFEKICVNKGLGLVTEVLGGHVLDELPGGTMGLGQVRYGTVGVHTEAQGLDAAQPALAETDHGETVALVHNGNITNMMELCSRYNLDYDDYSTDSNALVALIAVSMNSGIRLPEACTEILAQVEGAYSLIAMGQGKTVAVRDPYGFRPLMLGQYDNGGYAIASESHTLAVLNADFKREISRGEMVVCDQEGSLVTSYPFENKPSKLCAFEFIYFSAPHGELDGRNVHMVRKRMGEILATHHPVDADVVIGVPDSGVPASEGFSKVSGIPKVTGIVKNRYISRTFIAPDQAQREDGATKKFQIIQPEVYGKRVVVVDDSIVRGTTMKKLVSALRHMGASEVHLRIPSPPYMWPCFYGMDTPDMSELVANRFPDKKMLAEYLGVESIEFSDIEDLRAATVDSAAKLCMACMDKDYPTPIPVDL